MTPKVSRSILPVARSLPREGGSRSSTRTTIDPLVCHGKPCVRGLRYPVDFVLELLSSGTGTGEILADYEDLEPEDILAVLADAARLSQVKRIEPAA